MNAVAMEQSGQCEVSAKPHTRNLSLKELRDLGEAMLDPAGIEGLFVIVMRRLEVAWENAMHEVFSWETADLFKSAAAHGWDSPFPSTGKLRKLILYFYFADCAEPVKVEICAWGPARVDSPAHAERVGTWLEKIRKGAVRGLAAACVIALLLVGSGAMAALDDGDLDDDEDEERCALVQRPGGVGGAARRLGLTDVARRAGGLPTGQSAIQQTRQSALRGGAGCQPADVGKRAVVLETFSACRLGSRRHSRLGSLRYGAWGSGAASRVDRCLDAGSWSADWAVGDTAD